MPDKLQPDVFKLKAELCKTFADDKRLKIISELRGGEKAVSELVKVLKVPQAVVSRHLAILRHRGVVQGRREGVNIYYSLINPRILDACDIVHEVLMAQLAQHRKVADTLKV